MKFRLEAILELDDDLCDPNDPEQREWMWNLLAGTGEGGSLLLHSNEIGSEIGTVTFLREALAEGEERP